MSRPIKGGDPASEWTRSGDHTLTREVGSYPTSDGWDAPVARVQSEIVTSESLRGRTSTMCGRCGSPIAPGQPATALREGVVCQDCEPVRKSRITTKRGRGRPRKEESDGNSGS